LKSADLSGGLPREILCLLGAALIRLQEIFEIPLGGDLQFLEIKRANRGVTH
jgi:hypothetical protein